jgi:hypothetical protein
VVDFAEHGEAVAEQALVPRALAEVGVQRLDHARQAGLEGGAQAPEIVAALGEVGATRGLGGAQAVQGRAQVGERGIGGHVHTAESSAAFSTALGRFRPDLR